MVSTCLTFDFDAQSVWIGSVKSRNPSMISRGEFGAVAVLRILKILRKRDITVSFCVPGHTVFAYPDVVLQIHDEGHEIVHHGWIHENPADFDQPGERYNLERGIEAIEMVTGNRPLGYRSPAWDFSNRTVKLLLEYGFKYDSSLMGDDFNPYYVRRGDKYPLDAPLLFGKPVDLVELPVSWSLDDFPASEYIIGANTGLINPRDLEARWMDDFLWAKGNLDDPVFTITFHPQTIGRGGRLAMFERLLDQMAEQGAIYRTMHDCAMSWRRENPLERYKASGNIHATKSKKKMRELHERVLEMERSVRAETK